MKNKVMDNKKGQDLSIGTLILIVLGIVVLVLLILGFTMGWENLWEKINIFGGTSSVGDVVTACRLAQSNQEEFTLCQRTWDIEIEGQDEKIGCRDPRVLDSLEASASEFNCDISYPETLATGCLPKQTECIVNNPAGENCKGACKLNEGDSSADPPIEASCELADDATTTCSEYNEEEQCNNVQGCEFKS